MGHKKMKNFIRHLIELDLANNGEKIEDHERKRLYQWILGECLLRWPDVTKRDVWSAIQEVKNV